jgi:hypothetical protein
MKVTLESTSKIVTLLASGGISVPSRVWEGHTEGGVPCHAYITRIAVLEGLDPAEFDRDLARAHHMRPSLGVAALPNMLDVTEINLEALLRGAFEEGYTARSSQIPIVKAWEQSEARLLC